VNFIDQKNWLYFSIFLRILDNKSHILENIRIYIILFLNKKVMINFHIENVKLPPHIFKFLFFALIRQLFSKRGTSGTSERFGEESEL